MGGLIIYNNQKLYREPWWRMIVINMSIAQKLLIISFDMNIVGKCSWHISKQLNRYAYLRQLFISQLVYFKNM